MGMHPALDKFRLPSSDRCWWCGDVATTEEHRIKHSTLRRVARNDDGNVQPSNVFKKSSDFEGMLNSIKKGSQVRWRKNLCANCNNARSQPFDRAYDVFETFLVAHIDDMTRWTWLDWRYVYGDDWAREARNLARYFAKQMGCMLASQRLPVPQELITFLDGEERSPSTCFMLYINHRGVDAHNLMRSNSDEGLNTFVGLLESQAYQTDGRFSGVSYGYHIGYVVYWPIGSTAQTGHPGSSIRRFNYPESMKTDDRYTGPGFQSLALPGRVSRSPSLTRTELA